MKPAIEIEALELKKPPPVPTMEEMHQSHLQPLMPTCCVSPVSPEVFVAAERFLCKGRNPWQGEKSSWRGEER